MVSKESFLETFRSLFDETPPEKVQMDTEYKELDEWSSLIVLSVMVAMEENFGKSITAKQIEEAMTVEDLYNLSGTL
jgi:acyl carrier protein